jgi:hypothetical protein
MGVAELGMSQSLSIHRPPDQGIHHQCYGVDLLLTLLQVPSFANCFLTYDHRDTFVNGLVDLLIHLHVRRKALKDDASFILYKFLELFSLLSSFEDLHKTFSTVMTPNTPGVSQHA